MLNILIHILHRISQMWEAKYKFGGTELHNCAHALGTLMLASVSYFWFKFSCGPEILTDNRSVLLNGQMSSRAFMVEVE